MPLRRFVTWIPARALDLISVAGVAFLMGYAFRGAGACFWIF